ncbi:MAG: DNA-3-methyladenine glycosylase 2 family protein [Actinomycetota bacterium]|nr:DNA-3-methyladenine glycosylase 2 family protein [Actinomycetota bacterium]
MPTSQKFTITPRGPFSLREAATFGFGQRLAPEWDGVMRLAFCLDGYREQVGVEVRQDAGEEVHCVAYGSSDLEPICRQVERVLSLDQDASGYLAVGQRDPVVARLLAVAPGLRPPLFYSPYEAAAWAVLSARRPARQMAEVRRSLSEQHGRTFSLAGQQLAALPTPERLLTVTSIPGLSADKVERLHGVARAALTGQLDASRLQEMGPEAAAADVRLIKGIGPFYSALIVVRGTGFVDVAPVNEPKLLELVRQLYGLDAIPSPAEFLALADSWRPFRTWVSVLIRAAGPRILQGVAT